VSCVTLTEHAKARFSERTNIKRSTAEKNAERAFEHGVDRTEVSGGLRRYLDKKFHSRNCYRLLKVYCGYVYVFGAGGQLITMFEVPVEYRKRAMEIYKKKNRRVSEAEAERTSDVLSNEVKDILEKEEEDAIVD